MTNQNRLMSRRRDSNTRPLRPERSALPTAPLLEMHAFIQKRVQKYCFFLIYANYFALFLLKVRFAG